MRNGNYIKIDRKLLEWEWYGNINTKTVFLHMLLKANWKEAKFEGTTVPRGSFVSSYPRFAAEIFMSVNELRTALKHLISTGEITVKSHTKYSVFTVNNYNWYQDVNSQITDNSQAINSQGTGHAQTINSQLTTIEERKKERREESKKVSNNIIVDAAPAAPVLAKFPVDGFEMQCVHALIGSCLESYPNSKVPQNIVEKERWAADIERMKRLDHHTEEEIKQALQYAINDSFWKSNIRSGKKFRDKFETLFLQSQKKRSPVNDDIRQKLENVEMSYREREYEV